MFEGKSWSPVMPKPDQAEIVGSLRLVAKIDAGYTVGYLYLAKHIQTTHMADAAKQLLPTPRYVVKRSKS